jgi:DNA-directed RNA polymerase specialized sigma24 family protein
MPGTERSWADLDVPGSFERCVRGSIGELYAFAGLLCGNDRDAAERLVTGVYASLRRAVDDGLTDAVSLGALRSTVRRRWVDDRRIGLLAQIDEARRDVRPADTLGELRELERAVLVLHHVNRMPVERIAEELGIPGGRVEQIEASARRRLHGDAEPLRRWIRAYYGDGVHVRPDLADSILGHRHLGPRPAAVEPSSEPAGPAVGDDGDGPPTMAVHVVPDEPTGESAQVPQATDRDEPGAPTVQIDGDDELEPPDDDGAPPRPAPAAATAPVRATTPQPVDIDTVAGADDPRGGKRRIVAVAGVVLVGALVVVGALWWSSRGDDADGEGARPSAAPISSTSLPGASAAPTATSALVGSPAAPLVTGSTATVATGAGRFDPTCTERPAATTEPTVIEETALDAFGPLGAAPNLIIDLPAALTDAGPGDATASVLRVAGGVLVTARAGELDGESMVARIDADGTVRWVRCFADTAVVRGLSGAALADAAAIQFPGAGSTWQELSLVDGSPGAEVAEPPLPAVTATGDPVPWPDPALATLPGEAFTAGGTNGVTVVLGCAALAADGVNCDRVVLAAYNTTDNSLLWTRDGVSDVAIVRDGYAVIAYGEPGAAPWYMVSVTDGAAIDGQVWADPATFATGSDAATTSAIEVFGGVVARSANGSVSIWYPAAAGIETAAVTVP